jgi:hypothetical protein
VQIVALTVRVVRVIDPEVVVRADRAEIPASAAQGAVVHAGTVICYRRRASSNSQAALAVTASDKADQGFRVVGVHLARARAVSGSPTNWTSNVDSSGTSSRTSQKENRTT